MNDTALLLLAIEKLISSPLVTGLLIALGFFVLQIVIAVIFYRAGKTAAQLAYKNTLKRVREDALKRSRAVLGGLAGEQVAPFLPNFPCNPADARFVGKPIDFIAFPGAASGKDIEEILLIEVKSGDAQLSARERQIKSTVEQGKVRYIEYRI